MRPEVEASGYDGGRPFFRHARESGHPGQAAEPEALDSRFRGNDEIK